MAEAVMILVPPAPPTTILTSPFSSVAMAGHMDDSGLFPGEMALAGDGGTPK